MTPAVKNDIQDLHLPLRWQGELKGQDSGIPVCISQTQCVKKKILHLFPQSCVWIKHCLEPYSTCRTKSAAYFPTKSRCREPEFQIYRHSSKCQRSSTSGECLFWTNYSNFQNYFTTSTWLKYGVLTDPCTRNRQLPSCWCTIMQQFRRETAYFLVIIILLIVWVL